MMATTKLWTIEEVGRLPDDAFRYALLRGVLYRMPPPGGPHGLVANTAGRLVGNFVAKHRLGLVYNQSGFILDRNPDILLEPDVAFVRAGRWSANKPGYPMVAPDLVVEVASPSQTGPSVEEKTAIYLAAGVRLIWIIDPERRAVRVHRADGTELLRSEHDDIDGEDVLPGFRLPVAQLFA
jgi:Uma2 family endonuclease